MSNNKKKLIDEYNNFYKNNNFNLLPTVWNTNRNYINSSFKENDFRNDNAYIWQTRLGDGEKEYTDYYYKLKKMDKLNLFSKTKENGEFGCKTWFVNKDKILISRDLLDSIIEIYFLKQNFDNLDNLNILEIGAGYGRLCKRYSDCFQKSNYYITDGIPYSTYYSNIYLSLSNFEDKNIELYNLENKLNNIKIDIAINIHSFPEQNINDVEWWINLVHKHKIKYIFFVPNNPKSNPKFITTNNGDSILKIFNKYNYETICFSNMYNQLNIKYSYCVPFFLLENKLFSNIKNKNSNQHNSV
uniref:Sugar O-methyltransferase n=1 Tax=Mimivirus LCMiAC02 TaxID=2506609 RepID=A0A481Z246_9VIRU|nr:MAG: hypothetical protein LCMiAC02_05800 [Mimivirus LCMiAC02]